MPLYVTHVIGDVELPVARFLGKAATASATASRRDLDTARGAGRNRPSPWVSGRFWTQPAAPPPTIETALCARVSVFLAMRLSRPLSHAAIYVTSFSGSISYTKARKKKKVVNGMLLLSNSSDAYELWLPYLSVLHLPCADMRNMRERNATNDAADTAGWKKKEINLEMRVCNCDKLFRVWNRRCAKSWRKGERVTSNKVKTSRRKYLRMQFDIDNVNRYNMRNETDNS